MRILFLGPLPPPTHGFSAINAAMLARLKEEGTVIIFNRTTQANHSKSSVKILLSWLKLVIDFIFIAPKKPTSFYAGLSGGNGQILDIPFFLVARIFKIKTYIHHHSFAYLNKKTYLAAMCMKILSGARHIALCQEMADSISRNYKIPKSQVIVLSNSAFLPPLKHQPTQNQINATTDIIKVGFLSNITAEKGIFDFFAVVRRAAALGLSYEAEIAGPVDPNILDRFKHELSTLPRVKHLGPLYGVDKQQFFQRIDLLLFPTRYANEAEPVTLHEALQAGTAVVATQRGCIGGMLPDHCGAALPADAFETQALKALQELIELDPAQRLVRRSAIQQHYQETAARSEHTLRELVHNICHPFTTPS